MNEEEVQQAIQRVLETLPEKSYFRIGEVARITGVKAHVLRYWEAKFPLKPHVSSSGQRLFRRGDIEMVLRIKDLLWRRKFTVAGARRHLYRPDLELEEGSADDPSELPGVDVLREALLLVRARVRDLDAWLDGASLDREP